MSRVEAERDVIPVMQPRLPNLASLSPYIDRIDASRIYSNFGPLYCELADRLAEYFSVPPQSVGLFANGTLALQAAVETVGATGDVWTLPSWTFVASAQSLIAARRRPHFVDVEEDSWTVRAEQSTFARGQMVVAPFGSLPQVDEWNPVKRWKIFDAAACFDSCQNLGLRLDEQSAVMISLHATKSLPAGEGAVLIGPEGWVEDARRWGNFGFNGSRVSVGPGLNAKLSEYHCAVALASLDAWSEVRQQWASRGHWAVDVSRSLGLGVQPSLRAGFASTTWNVRFPKNVNLALVESFFRERGIETRRWWPSGVHSMPAFVAETHDELPITEGLVESVLGLPFGLHLTEPEKTRIENSLNELCSRNWE